jgi:NitT/TauT family transport system substrate-binding protein
MRLLWPVVTAALAVLWCGCSAEPVDSVAPARVTGSKADKLRPVRLALNWFPESEHGGYYHAQIKGLYAKRGLDVEIIKGGPGTPVEVEVGTGRVAFGIVNADKILSTRANGVPIVGLMAPFQISPRCIIVRESSPVQALADLRDLNLIANPTKPYIKYLQRRYGLEGVRITPYKGGMATFLADETAAVQGYVTSEPLVLRRRDVAVRVLPVSDSGYNPYTSVLVTSERMIAEEPDLVADMVKASQLGWLAYLTEPAHANAEIMRLNPEMDGETLRFGADQLKGLMISGDAEKGVFGMMTEGRWRTLRDQLVECDVIQDVGEPVTTAFTTHFLD